jgi:hypothetical protein
LRIEVVGEVPLDTTEEKPARHWHVAITWSTLILAGVILYELTNSPAVGTAALCSKFGWEDFKTAHWLRRFDRRRQRGRACWWLYVAWGLWKIGIAGLGVNFAIISGLSLLNVRRLGLAAGQLNRLFEPMKGAGIMLAVGISLSAIAAIIAALCAARARVRLWLHGEVTRARRANFWPPYDLLRARTNRIGALQLTSCMILCFVFVPAIGFSAGRLFRPVGNFDWAPLVFLVTALPTAIVWTKLSHFVTAGSPDQCWAPDEVAASPDDPVE